MAHTIADVIARLENFVRILDRRVDEVPYEIKTSIKLAIARGGHIDTTALINSLNYHRDAVVAGEAWDYRIDASDNRVRDVFYDGFLEFPRKGWAGAFVYQKGIESTQLEPVFDSIADEAFA
jgi:hypothetical protein